jgi:hypothetical protein
MIKRAIKIFPSLKKTILLDQSKHVQDKIDNKRIVDLIHLSFLKKNSRKNSSPKKVLGLFILTNLVDVFVLRVRIPNTLNF